MSVLQGGLDLEDDLETLSGGFIKSKSTAVGEVMRDELVNSFLVSQFLHLTVKEAELPWSQAEFRF